MPAGLTRNFPAGKALLRRLEPPHADEMAALHERAISPAWPTQDMIEHCRRDFCIGTGEPLTAFAIFRLGADQAEILTVVTDPEHRQKGLARQILYQTEPRLAGVGIEIIFLEVAEDNNPAIALYHSLGYEPFGRRPAYYRRPEGRIAALTFRKKLDAGATSR